MDLTIQQLRMLREVSRRGTIAAAAEELGYTPSAVSQQLSGVEKSTGVAMLERVGRNVLLTDAGRELVSHADIVLEQLEQAQAAIERVNGVVSGDLRLGFIESIGSTMLEPIMKQLRTEFPDLKLRTMAVDGALPFDLIRAGELDISFSVGSHGAPTEVPDGFGQTLLFRDWFRLVMPSTRFTHTKKPASVDLGSLVGEDFIVPPIDDSCGLAAVKACREAGLEPDVAHRVADFPTTLRLVGAEAGLALVPDLGLQRTPEDVAVIDLAQPRHRTVELVYRTSSAQRPSIKAFIEVVQNICHDMDLDCY